MTDSKTAGITGMPWSVCVFPAVALVFLCLTARNAHSSDPWALIERFSGDPASPSQALLPDNFDFVVTHRTEPKEQFSKLYAPYPADHDQSCAGPDPLIVPTRQHQVYTTQNSNGQNPDQSFYVCKHHMMSSMGEVGPYSVSAFWPRQEFDFADGGILGFDVNVNEGHSQRHWWEIMIVPREQLKVGAGPVDSAIDETYPVDRIVLDFRHLVRRIKVGAGALAPDGWLVNEREFGQYDWAYWGALHPYDPALADRRIRRTMRIILRNNRIHWGIRTHEGSWDMFSVPIPGGLPFHRGLVVFKTHAYTPYKQNNFDTYTFHWDNILFDGPIVGKYQSDYAGDVVYLQRDGHRQIGDSQAVSIDLAQLGDNPVLFGQLNSPKRGQTLLSINGRPNISVDPYQYDHGNCFSRDWKSFRLPLEPDWLIPGVNTFQWTVGPRPACDYGPYDWDGFSVKFLQIQTDRRKEP
ncbi:MAG: hypothetical protein AB8B87_21080 [Granulosicoccus sp.]